MFCRLVRMSVAVLLTLSNRCRGLEVALRNALHGQLTRCYGEAWYDNPEAGTCASRFVTSHSGCRPRFSPGQVLGRRYRTAAQVTLPLAPAFGVLARGQ